jgi:hypothetical protein
MISDGVVASTRKFLRKWGLEAGFLLLISFIIAYQVFVNGIGLSDNGDFKRLTDAVGISTTNNPVGNTPMVKFLCTYRYWGTAKPKFIGYPSSELLFMWPATLGSLIIHGHGIFDSYILALLHAFILLLAFIVLAFAAKRLLSWPARAVLYCMCLLVFGDVAYLSYLNAMYSEAAALTSLLLMTSTSLYVVSRANDPRPLKKGWFYLLAISAVVCITAKSQYVVIGFPIAALAYILQSRSPLSRQPAIQALMVILTATILYIPVFTIYTKHHIRICNLYDAVFNDLLRYSNDPPRDLKELGLDPKYSIYAGTLAYDSRGSSILEQSIPKSFGYAPILRFYAHHPVRFIGLLDRGARASYSLRPHYLGNFGPRSYTKFGKEDDIGRIVYENITHGNSTLWLPQRYMSQTFNAWSNIRQRIPHSSLLMLAFWITGVITACRIRYDRRQSQSVRLVAAVNLTLLAMAALEFFCTLLGEGDADLVKHLFLFSMLIDLCLVFLVMYATAALFNRIINKQIAS